MSTSYKRSDALKMGGDTKVDPFLVELNAYLFADKMLQMHGTQKIYGPLVEKLSQNRKFLDQRDARGQTPLYIAARNGNIHNVNFLLDEGASVDFPTADGSTPLRGAAYGFDSNYETNLVARLSVMGDLITKGANPLNKKDGKSIKAELRGLGI